MIQQKTRHNWIDAGRGISILLVVILHTSHEILKISPAENYHFWVHFSEILTPVRMPLFFVISGYLASSSMNKPLEDLFPKTAGLLFIYLFWTSIYISRSAFPVLRGDNAAPELTGYLVALLTPTAFWYIWALPFFYLVAWSLNRAFAQYARWIMLPCAVLALGYGANFNAINQYLADPLPSSMLGSVTSNALWFFAGLHFREAWQRTIANATAGKACVGALAYICTITLMMHLGFSPIVQKTLAAPLALWTSAQILGSLNFESRAGRTVTTIGQFTLPVYIFHLFGLAVMSGLFKIFSLNEHSASLSPTETVIIVPLISLLLITLSNIAGRIIRLTPFKASIIPQSLARPITRRQS